MEYKERNNNTQIGVKINGVEEITVCSLTYKISMF